MTGLIGKKVGMLQYYNAEGNVIPVTVIEAGPCVVVQTKDSARDGYNAVQVGFGTKKAQRLNKAMQGHMAKASKGGFAVLREFRVDDVSQFSVGQEIKVADLFKAGEKVVWSSHGQDDTPGVVVRKITSETEAGGRKVKASEDEPQYLVRSEKGGGEAVHKPSALRRR